MDKEQTQLALGSFASSITFDEGGGKRRRKGKKV